GGEEAAPVGLRGGEGPGGQERRDRARVAHGEARGRDPAQLLNRRDARQVRIVIDEGRLERDDADDGEREAPEDHARLDGGEQRGESVTAGRIAQDLARDHRRATSLPTSSLDTSKGFCYKARIPIQSLAYHNREGAHGQSNVEVTDRQPSVREGRNHQKIRR